MNMQEVMLAWGVLPWTLSYVLLIADKELINRGMNTRYVEVASIFLSVIYLVLGLLILFSETFRNHIGADVRAGWGMLVISNLTFLVYRSKENHHQNSDSKKSIKVPG